jgi:acetylornithine deacetylase/succinyl-diaminopimelate desuccinylase-like protein
MNVSDDANKAARQLCEKVDAGRLRDLALSFLRVESPTGREKAFSTHYADYLKSIGMKVKMTHEYPDSPNVIAMHQFGKGKTLQFDGHTDTIDKPHDPPVFKDGILYGRGACDMKGSLAAMVEATRIVLQSGVRLGGSMMLTAHGLHEAPLGWNQPLDEMIRSGNIGDAVVVGECAHDMLPVEGNGMSIFEVTLRRAGTIIHETKAPGMVNPIFVANEIVTSLRMKSLELATDRIAAIPPSLFVGVFSGGDFYNRVPVECTIVGTRRYSYRQDSKQVEGELRQLILDRHIPDGVTINVQVKRAAEGYRISSDDPLALSLKDSYKLVTGRVLEEGATTVCGNLPWFTRDGGIPAVYHGPDQHTAHADVECVSIQELVRLTKVYVALMARYCGIGE